MMTLRPAPRRSLRRDAGRIHLDRADETVGNIGGSPGIRDRVERQSLPLDAWGLDFRWQIGRGPTEATRKKLTARLKSSRTRRAAHGTGTGEVSDRLRVSHARKSHHTHIERSRARHVFFLDLRGTRVLRYATALNGSRNLAGDDRPDIDGPRKREAINRHSRSWIAESDLSDPCSPGVSCIADPGLLIRIAARPRGAMVRRITGRRRRDGQSPSSGHRVSVRSRKSTVK
jgi:hypothetical protein